METHGRRRSSTLWERSSSLCRQHIRSTDRFDQQAEGRQSLRDRRSAAGDSGNDAHLIASGERGGLIIKEADVLAVHVDIQKAA